MEVLVQEICEPSKQQHQRTSSNPLTKRKPRSTHPLQNPRHPQKGKPTKKKGKQELVLTPGLLADVGVEAGTHGDREEGFGPRTRRLRRRRERSPAKCCGGVGLLGGLGEEAPYGHYKFF